MKTNQAAVLSSAAGLAEAGFVLAVSACLYVCELTHIDCRLSWKLWTNL